MSLLERILRGMFGRKPPDPEARIDPAVAQAASESHAKIQTTQQLLSELRSRTDEARLGRARLIYEEGLYGRRGSPG